MNINLLLENSDILSWIFDGIGTEIISLILGALIGGSVGYKIGTKNKVKQKQKAGDSSKQMQTGTINVYNEKK